MNYRILIVGYGVVGKHIEQEFHNLKPTIYDPLIKDSTYEGHYDFAFICVPTDHKNGCDTSIVEQSIQNISASIYVVKSTVPPGTCAKLGPNVVFSPEHYGSTQHAPTPNFVILGGNRGDTAKVAELYSRVKTGSFRCIFTTLETAELSKYMLNCYLAMKVTFCAEFNKIADKIGVAYPELRELFVADERVGPSHTFVYPDKPYYDSHCFNKDVPSFLTYLETIEVSSKLLSAVDRVNSDAKALHANSNSSH